MRNLRTIGHIQGGLPSMVAAERDAYGSGYYYMDYGLLGMTLTTWDTKDWSTVFMDIRDLDQDGVYDTVDVFGRVGAIGARERFGESADEADISVEYIKTSTGHEWRLTVTARFESDEIVCVFNVPAIDLDAIYRALENRETADFE